MENEMQPPQQVTTWMIYDLLKDLKEDTNRKFGEVYELLKDFKEDTNRRFLKIESDMAEDRQKIDTMFHDVRSDMSEDRQKLNAIYEERGYVSVKFTRAWTLASFFIAILASMTVLAFEKAF